MILTRAHINPLWTERRDGNPVRIFEPRPKINGFLEAKILSVQLKTEFTRIDFRYKNDVQIGKAVYTISPEIRIVTPADRSTYTAEEDFFLIKSENAPISPKAFRTIPKKHELYFTLYFDPMPLYTLEFDIVEGEDEEGKLLMNYYKIDLSKGEREWEIKNSEN